MSNSEAAMFALIPCYAEAFEKRAKAGGNLSWSGMAEKVRGTRNFLYATAAITTSAATVASIAAVSAVCNEEKMLDACLIVTALGTALLGVRATAEYATKLYNATLSLQITLNSGEHPEV